MTRLKFGLLSICAMVFGLMAFNAPAAHAAKWLILKSGVLVPNLVATAAVESDTNGVLTTTIAGIRVKFECTATSSENVELVAEGKVKEGAKLILSGCETFLTPKGGVEELSKACLPISELNEPDVIRTKPLHGILVLHELFGGGKDDLLLVLPDNVEGNPSEIIALIKTGPECAVGKDIPIIGKVTIKDCEGLALTHLAKHLIEAGPLTELWAISKTAEHVATIQGSGIAKLTGAHVGLLWSGDPE